MTWPPTRETAKHRPTPRPKTLGDARRLIKETFERNRWDERAQRYYMNNLGIRPQPTEELSLEDTRTILDRMGRSHMIIFEQEVKAAA
jgi:hypothetical protein